MFYDEDELFQLTVGHNCLPHNLQESNTGVHPTVKRETLHYEGKPTFNLRTSIRKTWVHSKLI